MEVVHCIIGISFIIQVLHTAEQALYFTHISNDYKADIVGKPEFKMSTLSLQEAITKRNYTCSFFCSTASSKVKNALLHHMLNTTRQVVFYKVSNEEPN